MITWVLFLGIGLIVGVIAGLYFARLDDVSNKQKIALQQKVELAEQQLKTYQSQVAEHFLKTASLVNSMTESYKAVHEHLALGANQLCDNQVSVAQLEIPAGKLLDSAVADEAQQAKTDTRISEEPPTNRAEGAPAEDVATQQTAQHQEQASEDGAAPTQSEPKAALSEEAVQAAQTEPTQQKEESLEAIQPPSTPERLHVDETGAASTESLKETEKNTPVNISRTVH